MRFWKDFPDAEGERSAVYAIRREDWEALRKPPQNPTLDQGGPL